MNGFQRLSLLLVLAGLSLIYLSSMMFGPSTTSLGDIGRADIGDTVRVSGIVDTYTVKGDTQFLTLSNGETTLPAVHFGDELDVKEGANYTFEGRVDVYKGELELIVQDTVS